MDPLLEHDVPYGNDWDSTAEAAGYARAADHKRPWRSEIREHIAGHLAMFPPPVRVLELGSGPGLLAERVLNRCPNVHTYTLMDFSEPMLTLSRERLGAFAAASFVLASFKSADWHRRAEGPFHCVVSMQAVHELRHKQHAPRLYSQVRDILFPGGLFLICDHTPFDDSPTSKALYMTEHEQQQALAAARFINVGIELSINGLVLYAAETAA
jgi:ubiquinone/menaquinone biosynthesis C-methylase UbiE